MANHIDQLFPDEISLDAQDVKAEALVTMGFNSPDLYDQAVNWAHSLQDRNIGSARLIRVCFLILLFMTSSGSVKAADVQSVIEQAVTVATETPTPTATPETLSGVSFDFWQSGQIVSVVMDRDSGDIAVESLQDQTKVIELSQQRYLTVLSDSPVFKKVFPDYDDSLRVSSSVVLDSLDEGLGVENPQIQFVIRVVIGYRDQENDSEIREEIFYITVSSPKDDLFSQEQTNITYQVTLKTKVEPQATPEAPQSVLDDKTAKITKELLEKIIGTDVFKAYKGEGGDLLQELALTTPVQITQRNGYTIAYYGSEHSDLLTPDDISKLEKVGSLDFEDSRFGEVEVTNENRITIYDALEPTKILLQFDLPAGETLVASGEITVTADQSGSIFVFENLHFVDQKIAQGEKQLLVLHANYFSKLLAGNTKNLSAKEQEILKQLEGPRLESIVVPENLSLVVAEGSIFGIEVDPEDSESAVTVLTGPPIFGKERNSALPLIYPLQPNIPVGQLLKTADLFSEDGTHLSLENIEIESTQVTSFKVSEGVREAEAQAYLGLRMVITDAPKNKRYTVAGTVTLDLSQIGGKDAQFTISTSEIIPNGLLVTGESDIAILTPAPELSLEEKLERVDVNMSKDPVLMASWQLIKELIKNPKVANQEIQIAFGEEGYVVNGIYDFILGNGHFWPEFQVTQPIEFLLVSNQEKYEGIYGSLQWVPKVSVDGKTVGGYFVLFQTYQTGYTPTDATIELLSSLQIPIVVSSAETPLNVTGDPKNAFRNVLTTTAGMKELIEQGQVDDSGIKYAPLFFDEEDRSKEPITDAGKRLAEFVTGLSESVEKNTADGYFAINGFTIETLAINPYLFDILAAQGMMLSLHVHTSNNMSGYETVSNAMLIYDSSKGVWLINGTKAASETASVDVGGKLTGIIYDISVPVFYEDDNRSIDNNE